MVAPVLQTGDSIPMKIKGKQRKDIMKSTKPPPSAEKKDVPISAKSVSQSSSCCGGRGDGGLRHVTNYKGGTEGNEKGDGDDKGKEREKDSRVGVGKVKDVRGGGGRDLRRGLGGRGDTKGGGERDARGREVKDARGGGERYARGGVKDIRGGGKDIRVAERYTIGVGSNVRGGGRDTGGGGRDARGGRKDVRGKGRHDRDRSGKRGGHGRSKNNREGGRGTQAIMQQPHHKKQSLSKKKITEVISSGDWEGVGVISHFSDQGMSSEQHSRKKKQEDKSRSVNSRAMNQSNAKNKQTTNTFLALGFEDDTDSD